MPAPDACLQGSVIGVISAKLYSASARKLTTLQGFLDMLKTQPAKQGSRPFSPGSAASPCRT